MITHEQVHELAQFEDQASCALSFYFQPPAPQNKAHKEISILTKDLARQALQQMESRNVSRENMESVRDDLNRIVRLSQELRGNGVHAKAVFACAGQDFWREYDLPAQLPGGVLQLNRHFYLKPLAQLLGAFPGLGVVLLDRHRARLFDLRLGELTEREGFFHPLSRRGRSDGFAGYDAGHAERRIADEAREHYRQVADVLKNGIEKHIFEKWILGCQDAHWSQFEPQLHLDVARKLIGRFNAEVAHARPQEIREQAQRIFADWQERRWHELVRETIDQARSHGRGVTGLRRVLHALELGEVQTLLIGDHYTSKAVECSGCGHLDAHLVSSCSICGRSTRTISDVAEAILPWAIRHDVELFYVKDDREFDSVGNIAALLHYRSENGKVQALSDAASRSSLGRQEGLVGRYRGLAG